MNKAQLEQKVNFKVIVRSNEFDRDWSNNWQKVSTCFGWKEGFIFTETLHSIFKEPNEIEDDDMIIENTSLGTIYNEVTYLLFRRHLTKPKNTRS